MLVGPGYEAWTCASHINACGLSDCVHHPRILLAVTDLPNATVCSLLQVQLHLWERLQERHSLPSWPTMCQTPIRPLGTLWKPTSRSMMPWTRLSSSVLLATMQRRSNLNSPWCVTTLFLLPPECFESSMDICAHKEEAQMHLDMALRLLFLCAHIFVGRIENK